MKFSCMLLLFFAGVASAQKGKTILAIFAHADDEKIVSPVLAKYAAAGTNVFLVVATDGRYGVTEHAKIPEGDSMASVRYREIHCAAVKLGIHPPILLGIHDGLDLREGKGGEAIIRIRDSVISLFIRLKPDVVITWGPSGWTSHPDHRIVGDIVTEVFAERQWGKPAQLFYPEIPTNYLPEEKVSYATVDSTYLPVRITLSESDLTKARAALHCHASQYTWQYAEDTQSRIWNTPGAVAFLRPFISTRKIHRDLFYKP